MDSDVDFTEVKELVQELLKKQIPDNVGDIINSLFTNIRNLETAGKVTTQDVQIEESAVSLWNWAVMQRVGSIINDEQRAKLRHISCKLVYMCENAEPSEGTIRRQILMSMKTGKGWVDNGKPALADGFLDLAVNSLELLYGKLTSRSAGQTDVNVHKNDVEKDLFKVISYQAESAVSQGNFQKAMACVGRCKDMLLRLPKEMGYLSLLCYNFGVETYEQKRYEESAFWLSQSYEIGKMDKKYSPGSAVQAKVLRLLANVYLEWDCRQYQEKALNAVRLANEENLHPAGLYLKIKILLKCGCPDEEINGAIGELEKHEVSLDVCLNTAELLVEHDRESLAYEFLKTLCKHFEASPDLGKVVLMHIELLLQRGKELLAKQKVEDVITGHYTGNQLSPETVNRFHIILWDRAAKNFEMKNYLDALQWYNYSLSFYSAGQMDQNLAKLQRNRASCFLYLKQLDKAKEAVKEAEKCDPDSIFTQFNIYKIAILENDTVKAVDAVTAMGKLAANPIQCEDKQTASENVASNLLKLAAQIALENEQQDAAIKALEYSCNQCHDSSQVFTALRCLIRLMLSKMGSGCEVSRDEQLDALLSYLKLAYHKLTAPLTGDVSLEFRNNEANWFRKIGWNLALRCEGCPGKLREFFILCFQFSQLCPPDKAMLIGQKTCLLMAAAASLEMGRNASTSSEQTDRLTQALEHIQMCWEIWRTLKSSGDFPKDPTETLLLLYEFEARAKLNDPTLGDVLESALELQQIGTKTLETMASLAMESPAYFPSISKKALKNALCLYRKQPNMDVTMYSKCLHSLVQLSLPTNLLDIESRVLKEVWGYYEEALAVMENTVRESQKTDRKIANGN
ncbi:testis-expressed protein 11 [Latimeria chalumnae]|uniref:testis-expressed protein 11 n=1 Tax=Latimeria chalumnae TaxID=7897 RepID=UPI00313BF6F2